MNRRNRHDRKKPLRSEYVRARQGLCALGLLKQVGWRNSQPLWEAVAGDDVPVIGQRYLELTAQGRHEEAEELARQAMETYDGL
jgi:hypothetical protein